MTTATRPPGPPRPTDDRSARRRAEDDPLVGEYIARCYAEIERQKRGIDLYRRLAGAAWRAGHTQRYFDPTEAFEDLIDLRRKLERLGFPIPMADQSNGQEGK